MRTSSNSGSISQSQGSLRIEPSLVRGKKEGSCEISILPKCGRKVLIERLRSLSYGIILLFTRLEGAGLAPGSLTLASGDLLSLL
jgi:hypothetical protein